MRAILQNKQEYLDLLVKTSREGGFPSAVLIDCDVDPVQCRYRCPDGRACAAGLLIPDERYDDSMENKSCVGCDLDDVWPDWVRAAGVAYLRAVQAAHDDHAETVLKYEEPWDHHGFVSRLQGAALFRDVEPAGGWEVAKQTEVTS